MLDLYLSGVDYESVTDGPGVRTSIFLSGCKHMCPGCHNPETHNPQFGSKLNDVMIETIAYFIGNRPYLDGITLTGGDPLYNPEATLEFVLHLKRSLDKQWNKLSVWLYTGYTWEQIEQNMQSNDSLKYLVSMIDVIVDGQFIESLSDKRLAFKGSSNQRIIDVKSSIENKSVVLYSTLGV